MSDGAPAWITDAEALTGDSHHLAISADSLRLSVTSLSGASMCAFGEAAG